MAKTNLSASIREKYYLSPKLCKQCGNPIPIKDSPANTRRLTFCSRTCSAKYNIKAYPRVCRKRTRECVDCGSYPRKGAKRCQTCYDNRISQLLHRTKKELSEQNVGTDAYLRIKSRIASNARAVYKASHLPMQCYTCGYSKHVDISHKRAVNSFPDSATIAEINDITNLVPLCPNHHWEHDHPNTNQTNAILPA